MKKNKPKISRKKRLAYKVDGTAPFAISDDMNEHLNENPMAYATKSDKDKVSWSALDNVWKSLGFSK